MPAINYFTLVLAVLVLGCCSSVSKPEHGAGLGATSGAETNLESKTDRFGIRAVIGQNMTFFERCYLAAIEAYPGARGKIVAQWIVNDQGATSSIIIKEIDPSLKGADTCVINVLRSLTFSKLPPGEEIEVFYPFYFSENGKFN